LTQLGEPGAPAPAARLRRGALLGVLASVATMAAAVVLASETGRIELVLGAMVVFLGATIAVVAPHLGTMTAFAALFLAQFAAALPLLRPTENNYQAYTAGLLLTLYAGVVVRRGLRFSAVHLFFLFLLASVVVYALGGADFVGYAVLVVPVLAVCSYGLARSAEADELRFVVWAFLAFAGVEAALGILQSIAGWPYFELQYSMTTERDPLGFIVGFLSPFARNGLGTFPHFNALGALLSLAIPIAFVKSLDAPKRFREPIHWLLVLLVAGAYVSYSRGAWLGCLVGVLLVVIVRATRRRRTAIAAWTTISILAVTAVLWPLIESYYLTTQNLTIRLGTWSEALGRIAEEPFRLLLGFGYSSFHLEATSDQVVLPGQLESLHSWPVQVTVELGLAGLALFLLAVLPPVVRGCHRSRPGRELAVAAGVVGFLVSQLFDNSLFGGVGVFMFLLLGVLQALQSGAGEPDREPGPPLATASQEPP